MEFSGMATGPRKGKIGLGNISLKQHFCQMHNLNNPCLNLAGE